MDDPTDLPLSRRCIAITADRRWEEQAGLFSKRGATVLHGPTLRTVDLSADAALRSVTEELIADSPDYVVATTGIGMRFWLGAAAGWGLAAPLSAALGQARIVARGAKSASAVKAAGFSVWWQAPGERMDDIVEHLGAADITGARVALQLFDPADHPSTAALRALARQLVEVPVYRWRLPDDRRPADRLIGAVLAGRVDAVTFTAQPAVYHLFRLAGDRSGALREALNGPVVCACVGPVCAEAASEEGLTAPIWPDPPRLPAMVRMVTERLQSS